METPQAWQDRGVKLAAFVFACSIAAAALWDANEKRWTCGLDEQCPDDAIHCGVNQQPARSNTGAVYCSAKEPMITSALTPPAQYVCASQDAVWKQLNDGRQWRCQNGTWIESEGPERQASQKLEITCRIAGRVGPSKSHFGDCGDGEFLVSAGRMDAVKCCTIKLKSP